MYVPTIKPTIPITITIIFFINNHIFSTPLTCFQYVQICMMAGNDKPNADKQSAPNNDINNSKFGIATANKTKINIKIIIFFNY